MPTLPFFEDLSRFVPNNLFIAGYCDSDKAFFSWHSRNCFMKEKLLIASHNALLFVLLDLWEQNVLVLDEESVGRLMDL